jgi:UDP-N-acetylmuramoylalanine--D-glutamate ligase
VILELSSYQLENASSLSFQTSAITYLSKNHLERYSGVEEYYQVKWNLARQTHGPVVLNLNGGDLANFVKERMRAGDGPHSDYLHWVNRDCSFLTESELARSQLVGAHNRDNLAVAAEVARLCGWPATSLEAMLLFAGLPHRVESIGEYQGVRFINDSKATTMESVLTATQSVCQEARGEVWLLLGGRDKKLPWDKLKTLLNTPRLRFVFFGECGAHARALSELEGECFSSLNETMRSLPKLVRKGDTVLLSPGGTSLDEFKNFEDRGIAFANMARERFGS